jgi:GntR family transcriptional regulator
MTVIDLALASRGRIAPEPSSGRSSFLYERVIEFVESLIEEHDLRPGDILPTQAELGELVGVSRITVTRALENLEHQGRVRRHQGLGTFVARPRIVSDPMRLGGLVMTLSSGGTAPTLATRVLSLDEGQASPDLQEALGLETGESVWRIERERMLGAAPLILETSVVPRRLAPDLDRHRGELSDSLYELLERRYGLKDEAEQQLLDVVTPTELQRRRLRLRSRDLVARIRGLSVDPRGVAFDGFEQIYPTTDFAFCISAGGIRQLLVDPRPREWAFVPEEAFPARHPSQRSSRARTTAK